MFLLPLSFKFLPLKATGCRVAEVLRGAKNALLFLNPENSLQTLEKHHHAPPMCEWGLSCPGTILGAQSKTPKPETLNPSERSCCRLQLGFITELYSCESSRLEKASHLSDRQLGVA